jgi:hypothetical protein
MVGYTGLKMEVESQAIPLSFAEFLKVAACEHRQLHVHPVSTQVLRVTNVKCLVLTAT